MVVGAGCYGDAFGPYTAEELSCGIDAEAGVVAGVALGFDL